MNIVAINTIWTLIAAILVFMMHAGFAMLETGFTRAKNATNIMMKNLMDFSIGTLAFWAVGYGIMFGVDAFFLTGATAQVSEGLSTFTTWMFHVVFAATAATIVSGAVAERTQFKAYLIYTVFITALIYPVVGRWIWGGGWLSDLGFIDFAGSTVVHSVGGWAGLAGAFVLGPRIGKYVRTKIKNSGTGALVAYKNEVKNFNFVDYHSPLMLGIVVGTSIFTSMSIACLVASVFPVLLEKLKIDPAIFSLREASSLYK